MVWVSLDLIPKVGPYQKPVLNISGIRIVKLHKWLNSTAHSLLQAMRASYYRPLDRVLRSGPGHKTTVKDLLPKSVNKVLQCGLVGALSAITSGPEVLQIFKVCTVLNPDVLFPGRWSKQKKNPRKRRNSKFSKIFFVIYFWHQGTYFMRVDIW